MIITVIIINYYNHNDSNNNYHCLEDKKIPDLDALSKSLNSETSSPVSGQVKSLRKRSSFSLVL